MVPCSIQSNEDGVLTWRIWMFRKREGPYKEEEKVGKHMVGDAKVRSVEGYMWSVLKDVQFRG